MEVYPFIVSVHRKKQGQATFLQSKNDPVPVFSAPFHSWSRFIILINGYIKVHSSATKIIARIFAVVLAALSITAGASAQSGPVPPPPDAARRYGEIKEQLARGWNTWDTHSVLTHALLPDGLGLKLQFRDLQSGGVVESALIGQRGAGAVDIIPGPHSYDGSYTDLRLKWRGMKLRVQSAAHGRELAILVSPEEGSGPAVVIIRPEMLFGKNGEISIAGNMIRAPLSGGDVSVFVTGKSSAGAQDATGTMSFSLDSPAGISTGGEKTIAEIEKTIADARAAYMKERDKYGKLADLHDAMRNVLAWNVIYAPAKDAVTTPVSRGWSIGWGGYVLFCWDTYFASYMLSLDSRELAYANAIEITSEMTDTGFVPNFGSPNNNKSFDRSQPPVGSLVVREIYRKYREKWFLEYLFDNLLTWNRWWEKNRVTDGLLCWGSNPYKDYMSKPGEVLNVNQRMGAALESGLDNSPMYDNIPFNTKRHQLKLNDAGLTALYVMDCDALADIARVIGRTEAETELRARAEKYRAAMQSLWSDEKGIYLNKRTDTKELSPRMSPTNFYPFLAKAPSAAQADRMIKEQFYNPGTFWGEWIMPSISRDDPDFGDNEYWRGRIWAPMNFLVYMGMRNYGLDAARKDLVDKSAKLLLKSWLGESHVYENYNSVTGTGDDVGSSDKFYHWGALLGFISFIEDGFVPAPEKTLD